jgi:hypothetical protein
LKNAKFLIFPLFLVQSSAIAASVILLWGTGIYGIGISPDSTIYIDVAKNLLAGNGFVAFSEPMTLFPPAYPIIYLLVE